MDIFKFYGMDNNLGRKRKYRNYKISAQCKDICNVWKNYIKNLNNGTIVEIGVHGGYSLLRTHDEANKNNKIYGIDCWERIVEVGINGYDNEFWLKESIDRFLKLHKKNRTTLENLISEHKLNIKLLWGFSSDNNIINNFEDESIDAIYIDGDHGFEGCYNDIKNYYPKVKKGGLILCDDYVNVDTVKLAVDKFCEENNIDNGGNQENKYYFYKK